VRVRQKTSIFSVLVLRRRERIPRSTPVGTDRTLKSLPAHANTSWLQPDPAPVCKAANHNMVARHSTGISLVTRFPATAPATSHFLGGRVLGPLLLPPPPPPLPPPHGCTPRHRHRLGYPIPRHGTRYLTLPWRSRAPPCAPTQHQGYAPRHRHRLCHPVPRHGTRYLTLPRRSRALACAPVKILPRLLRWA